LADNLTTPVADGKTLAAKDIGGAGILYPWNLIADSAGADLFGQVTAAPTAFSVLGRLKTIADGIGAATPAGENYMGKIGGDVLLTAPAAPPTVSASAYAAGQVIGTKFTLPNAARVAAGAGLIQAATLLSKTATTAAIDIIIFSADPTASTLTDKTAPTIAAADIDKIVGVIHLTDWSALGTAALAQNLAVGLPFRLPAGTSLYAVLIARAAITPGSTTDLLPAVRIIPG